MNTKAIVYTVIGIALGYYILIVYPQQQIQKQEIQAEQSAQSLKQSRDALISREKSDCSQSAQTMAVQQYESSYLCQGAYAPSDCTDNSTFLISQEKNDYDQCVQGLGL